MTSAHTHVLSGLQHPLLGTVADITIAAHDRADAERAEQVMCDEITRLKGLFSIDDDTSMLRRWIAEPSTPTCNEFDELLSTALRWQRCSRGVFNVSTGRLRNLWAQAAAEGCRPSPGELHVLAAEINDAPYRFDGHLLHQVGECSGVDLDSIARGFVIDLACDAAWRLCDLDSLTVSAGGDVVHRGPVSIPVDVADPAAPLDSASSIFGIDVRNAALATRGLSPNGDAVGGDWVDQVLDPRTGEPVHRSTSVTVVAPDATTAGIVALVVRVMEPAEAIRFVDALNSKHRVRHPAESFDRVTGGAIECWIVDRQRVVHHTGP